ncbi:hypothetical protein DMENIID0001_050530 [Sergentomyia squamirostris]
MNFLIVFFMLMGAANLSSQSPVSIHDIDPIFMEIEDIDDDDNDDDDDDLALAENNIFRPYFRYRQRTAFRRRAREAQDFAEKIPQIPSDIPAADDLQVAENNIFRPYFRLHQRALLHRRGVREATAQNFAKELPSIPSEDGSNDDLQTAEYYFMPYFRYRQRSAYRRRTRIPRI